MALILLFAFKEFFAVRRYFPSAKSTFSLFEKIRATPTQNMEKREGEFVVVQNAFLSDLTPTQPPNLRCSHILIEFKNSRAQNLGGIFTDLSGHLGGS